MSSYRNTFPSGPALAHAIAAESVRPGTCTLWWLGQMGFVIKFPTTTVFVDAYLSPSPSRRIPPLFTPGEVPADLILGTHDHSDHIDRPAWTALATADPHTRFIVTDQSRESLAPALKVAPNRLIGLDHGTCFEQDGIRITGIAAAHEFLDRDPASGRHPYLGYVIESHGFTLYHAGDTCRYEGLITCLSSYRPDTVILPINGRDARRLRNGCIGNMTYQEAADLAGSVQANRVIPGHYDMFDGNREDVRLFTDYVAVKYPQLIALVPEYGQPVRLGNPDPT